MLVTCYFSSANIRTFLSYPMEMHLVHYKKTYGSLGEAIKHKDGLTVLGIFFTISEEDNKALNPIISNLSSIMKPGQSLRHEI